MNDTPPKPELTPEMEELMRVSRCDLVLVGGMNVGMNRGKQVWHIRSRYETDAVQMLAKTSQKHAAAVRKVCKLEKQLAAKS